MPHVLTITGRGGTAVDRYPATCPICQTRIVPTFIVGDRAGERYEGQVIALFRCPSDTCHELFLAYYAMAATAPYRLLACRPSEPPARAFADFVQNLSPRYCEIYIEAEKAEALGLRQICGGGYRKALEFLIKDYLIARLPDDEAPIKKALLGNCIESYVTDPHVKSVAKRAVWLGNDETHYERRWMDRDLSDLKVLLELVLRWIETEHLTEQALRDMPPP